MTDSAASLPRVTVIVVSYNTREDLRRCLASVRAHAGVCCQIVVVDNASGDGSADAVTSEFPEAQVLRNRENLGFSRANNQAIRQATAPYVLILNSDAQLTPGALPTLAARLDAKPRLGAVGPRIVGPDGIVEVSFGPELRPVAEWRQRRLVRGVQRRHPAALRRAETQAAEEHAPAWVSAACLLARKQALDSVGGFDEGFFLYEEDVDLCLRLRHAGWEVLFAPAAEVVHGIGHSTRADPARARLEYHRSHLRFYRKHNGAVRTAALRAFLGTGAVLGWLLGLGPGPERGRRRRHHGEVLRLALADRPAREPDRTRSSE